MAKLPRKTQKIFCSKPTSENQTSVFGTMKTADKQYSTDVGTLQSNAAYEQGWKSATIASYKPFMEDFNTLNYINTSQLAYLFQQGIPEWDEATAYYKNSFCSYNGDLWQSLIDDNLGNAPFEGDEWTLFSTKNKGGGLELCDIGMALYVDETKGLRRYLNGQIVDINTNTQAFLNRLLQIKTTNPDYFTTEDNWQSEATLNVDGCVYKFVLNYSGETVVSVRLPKYPEYVEINAGGTLPVVGNGTTLGLTNGKGYFCGISPVNEEERPRMTSASGLYGVRVGSTNLSGSSKDPSGLGVTTDPKKSGIQTTLNQTKLKMRYFIQIATGSETENNIINDIELNNPFTFGMSQYYKGEMNNISWLKSYGQWNSKAIYPSFYNWAFQQLSAKQFDPSKITVVGSPTITNDGVASGFSVANYIKSNSDIAFTAGQTWEIDLKVNIKNSESGINKAQCLFQICASNPSLNSLQAILYNNCVFWTCPTTPSGGATNRFLQFTSEFNISSYLNQDIWFKFIYNGTQYIFEWSADGINFTREVASTDSRQFTGTGTLNLGAMSIHQQGLQGSIYLNDTKITVNGEEVYSPTKRLEGFKRNTENYDDYDFVINATDETFRLPLKNGMEGVFASGVKGNGKALVVTDGNGNERNLFQPGNDYIFTNDNVAGNLPHVTASYNGNQTNSYALGTNVGLTTDPTKSGIVVDTTVPQGWNLYYYVGETVQNANLIDAGRIGEQLANKQDKCIHITDTYRNGTSWYRIWSDGWCEQGGELSAVSSTASYTIQLLKPYQNNAQYNILGSTSPGHDSMYNEQDQAGTFESKTSSSFVKHLGVGSAYRWYVFGFLN